MAPYGGGERERVQNKQIDSAAAAILPNIRLVESLRQILQVVIALIRQKFLVDHVVSFADCEMSKGGRSHIYH